MTGAFDRIDFIGVDDQKLARQVGDGADHPLRHPDPRLPEPDHADRAAVQFGNADFGRGVEDIVFWAADLLVYLREHGYTRIRNTVEAEERWNEHVRDMYDMLLLSKTKSWFTGYNSNVEGRDTIRYVAYNGGAPRYRKRLAECAAKGYEGFVLA